MPKIENVTYSLNTDCVTDCGPMDLCGPDDYCNPDDDCNPDSK